MSKFKVGDYVTYPGTSEIYIDKIIRVIDSQNELYELETIRSDRPYNPVGHIHRAFALLSNMMFHPAHHPIKIQFAKDLEEIINDAT